MKKAVLLTAALLALGACSHRPTRDTRPQVNTVRSEPLPPVIEDGTVSGSPSSLGAVSSGRGH